MKDMLIGQDRMSRNTAQKGLEHALPTSNHDNIFFRLALLDSIITNSLF